ncbi:MAG: YiiD C-terminal domain-containing protein [Pseudomonadota bacterium]|nr:YiiD C-terminal domain-containing protein [Pseudomonadota bacterium]
MNLDGRTQALLAEMSTTMPALAGIGVECLELRADTVRLTAPLARNQNDKQTAFAGSLSALGMLCGWALTQRVAMEHALHAQCAIYDVHTRFRQPVRTELIAHTRCELSDRRALIDALARAGKARWTLDIEVGSSDLPDAVRLSATYAAWVTGLTPLQETSAPA